MAPKLVLILCFAAVIVIFGLAAIPGASEPLHAAPTVSMEPARVELLSLLGDYKRAWKPVDREGLLERGRRRRDVLEPALLWLLGESRHSLIDEGLELVAEYRSERARPLVVELADDPALRAHALDVADRIEPWPDTTIADFFADPDVSVVLSAIRMARRRQPRVVPGLLELIGHGDTKVREAALAAIPPELDDAQRAALHRLVERAEVGVAAKALSALGRAEITESCELFLGEQLDRSEDALRSAAIDALAQKGRPLLPTVAATLWRIVEAGADSRALTARTLRCLERTNSVAAWQLRSTLPDLDPWLRYFAARCLVRLGEPQGVRALLHLLEAETHEFLGIEQEQIDEVRFAVRSLLGSLAGTAANVEIEVWQRWSSEHPIDRPRALPAPALDY